MKKVCLLLVILLALLPVFPADAAESREYDGYLLQVRTEGAQLFSSLPEGIEPVAPGAGIYRVDSVEDAAFFRAEEIVCIEPDYLVELFDTGRSGAGAWNLDLMGADTAARAGLDGSGVRIGVIDSGLYADHELLAGAHIVAGHDYVNNIEDTADQVGHGTFVTGIITAMAPGAEVVPLKCFDSKSGRLDHIVAAVYGAVDEYGCDILNMSFGVSGDSTILRNAIQYAAGKGVVLTAAVGNDGTAEIKYPAGYDQVIGVGMVSANKTAPSSSQRNRSVLLAAPGSGLTGLAITGPSACKTGYGTSYACPHVTAAAALLLQAAPDMTADGVRTAMINGAEDLGDAGYDETYGYGFLSVTAMLEALPPLPVRSDAELRMRVVRSLPGGTPQVWAASYSGTGRMLACHPLPASVEEGILAVNGVIPLLEETEWVKLFFLRDGCLEPAREMESVRMT